MSSTYHELEHTARVWQQPLAIDLEPADGQADDVSTIADKHDTASMQERAAMSLQLQGTKLVP